MYAQTHQGAVRRGVGAVALTVALFAAACGGGDEEADDGPTVIDIGGSVEVALPDSFDADQTAGSSSAPETDDVAADDTDEGDGDEADDATESTTTLPVTEEEETGFEGVQSASQKFNQCISVAGYEFIGFNDPTVPGSSDPDYLEVLAECAAESRIVESLAEADSAITDDPEAIQQRNEGWLRFRDCLIDRGWTVPEPVPDANGLLFRIEDFADPEFRDGFFGPNGETFSGGNSDSEACQAEAGADDDG